MTAKQNTVLFFGATLLMFGLWLCDRQMSDYQNAADQKVDHTARYCRGNNRSNCDVLGSGSGG